MCAGALGPLPFSILLEKQSQYVEEQGTLLTAQAARGREEGGCSRRGLSRGMGLELLKFPSRSLPAHREI
jgi:hypothetical protein